MQSAKHSGQRLRFTCSHFREIIYVEALLPRPHMPGQICPRVRFKSALFTSQCSFARLWNNAFPSQKNVLVVRETYLIYLVFRKITFAVVGYMHAQKEGLELDCPSQVFRKVTNHNRVGLAGGGRGGGEGRNRALRENAETAQMRGRVSRKSTSFFVL